MLRLLKPCPLDESIVPKSTGGFAEIVYLCGQAVRQHRFPDLIEQAEPGSRLHGLCDALVEVEIDGYELCSFGSLAIGVVTDAPRGTPRSERARLDVLTVGELLLAARVAVDLEQVVPGHGATDDGGRR